MGHFSPLGRQRGGQKPDGVCLVVGSCAQGFPKNNSGDLLVSFTPLQNQCQYWEAFPARDGRTTYLFTYMDAHQSAQFGSSVRGLSAADARIPRRGTSAATTATGTIWVSPRTGIHCGRLGVAFCQLEIAAAISLSFGGFGAMVRHLKRLTAGIHEALSDQLSLQALALYNPISRT